MKPSSLLGIALELIQEIAAPGKYPADARVGRFFRARRYLGSRDRRFVGDTGYAWLRHGLRARARWNAWLTSRGAAAPAGESVAPAAEYFHHVLDVLAMAREGRTPWDFAATAEAARGLPRWKEMDDAWSAILEPAARDEFLAGDPWPDGAVERFAAEMSLPVWLGARLLEERGEAEARRLASSLLETARVDLRVNSLKVERETARRRLATDTGAPVELTHFSPLGLYIEKRLNLTATTASRKGWVEVQDEGSQLAVLCCDPEPRTTIIDACAGGGGKTLAITDIVLRLERDSVATSRARTRILAFDVEEKKLQELARRASDAGVENHIRLGLLSPGGPLPSGLPQADLVLVDAPCSGLGTLRRNPELKRVYGPGSIRRFAQLQLSILERFAPAVRAGGRLAYVTCSILREECGEVVAAFEKHHPEFRPTPSRWAATRLPRECIDGHTISLDPPRTHSDAFFIALWERVTGNT